jgi:agmatinase
MEIRMQPLPFQTAGTFLSLPPWQQQPLAVLGAPYDGATTFRSGSRMGPSAIRDISLMLTDGAHPDFDVDLKPWVGDAGNIALPTGNTLVALQSITQALAGMNAHVVTLGGDHSITLGVLRALQPKHGTISVLHLDAHCDTWSDHFGEPHGHGTWLRNVIEEGLVDAHRVISVGVRSACDSATRSWLRQQGGQTVSAWQALAQDPLHMAHNIARTMGQHVCYLSLDIDCLDPSHAPGTGTPEIGGLTTAWVMQLLRHLQPLNWVGMDCVEVAPAYDHSGITALAAATFVWSYLSMITHKITA